MNLQINEVNPPKQISYEDILSKMGMFVANGKLHLIDTNKKIKSIEQKPTAVNQMENSYIYNKYFKDMVPTATQKQPKTVAEYQQYLLEEILLQKIAKLRQLKYRKIIIPQQSTHNHAYNDPNKLFDFSKR